jgi:AcrR family transcriptional regulator
VPRELIWMRPESAGVGRPAAHTRAEITAAAVAVAEADGFAAVTMRRVAAQLGTGAASLYRYVDNRADLVDLMIDSAYAGMVLRPTGRGWRADLVEVGRAGMRLAARHPWFADALAEHPAATGPGVARLTEFCLSALAGHPAPGPRKMEAVAVMGGMVRQYADAVARQPLPEVLAAHTAYLRHVSRDGQHPHLAAALAETDPAAAGSPDPVELLARLLGMVLDGILGPD